MGPKPAYPGIWNYPRRRAESLTYREHNTLRAEILAFRSSLIFG